MSADTFSLIVNTCIAVGTLGAVGVALWYGQKQRADVLNARYDSQRPIVCPTSMTPNLDELDIRNTGAGVATDIIATVMAWASPGAGRDGMYRYIFHFGAPLAPGPDMAIAPGVETSGSLKPDTTLRTHREQHPLLWAKDKDSSYPYTWRVVITYHDIFGRKLASIFDAYMDQRFKRYVWHCEALLVNIAHDLSELDRQV